jgi:hypothetical protein
MGHFTAADRIFIKDGVCFKQINGCTLQFIEALLLANRQFGRNHVITSANDGKHCETSYHYRNLAWDVRTRDLTHKQIEALAEFLKAHLFGFDIVIEKDHIHVERDLEKWADEILLGGLLADGLPHD